MENQKKILRKDFKLIRDSLSDARKKEASIAAVEKLYKWTQKYDYVLSFASKKEEINLWPLNEQLANEKRLLLPYCHQFHLEIYQVLNIKELVCNKYHIFEPNPKIHPKIPLDREIAVLVPALAFDSKKHRLGYGQGFYDRFLAQANLFFSIGVGFKEQKYAGIFPQQKHDIAMQKVMLF